MRRRRRTGQEATVQSQATGAVRGVRGVQDPGHSGRYIFPFLPCWNQEQGPRGGCSEHSCRSTSGSSVSTSRRLGLDSTHSIAWTGWSSRLACESPPRRSSRGSRSCSSCSASVRPTPGRMRGMAPTRQSPARTGPSTVDRCSRITSGEWRSRHVDGTHLGSTNTSPAAVLTVWDDGRVR